MKTKLSYRAIYLNLFLLISLSSYCQDIINKKNGESISSKIDQIDQTTIKYKKYNNLSGPFYLIDKSEVSSITFENGTVENFQNVSNSKELSKVELQGLIISLINEHGFDPNTFDRKYKATFEGDYLRLIVLHTNGEPSNDNVLYDFSNVYKFQHISKRSDKLVFINIFVSIAINKKLTNWDKHKLVMRVHNYEYAESIVDALKKYNSILTKVTKH